MASECGSFGKLSQVPQLDSAVVGARDELFVGGVCGQALDGVTVGFGYGLVGCDLVH